MQAAYVLQDRALLAFLRRINDGFSGAWRDAIFAEIGRRVEGIFVVDYPAATGAKMSDLWTPKQRRWFFAALRDGRVQVPYRRTEGLKRAFKSDLKVVEDHAVLTIGIPESDPRHKWAPYVMGSTAQQSTYFRTRTGWKPAVVQIMRRFQAFENMVRLVAEGVIRDLGGFDVQLANV